MRRVDPPRQNNRISNSDRVVLFMCPMPHSNALREEGRESCGDIAAVTSLSQRGQSRALKSPHGVNEVRMAAQSRELAE